MNDDRHDEDLRKTHQSILTKLEEDLQKMNETIEGATREVVKPLEAMSVAITKMVETLQPHLSTLETTLVPDEKFVEITDEHLATLECVQSLEPSCSTEEFARERPKRSEVWRAVGTLPDTVAHRFLEVVEARGLIEQDGGLWYLSTAGQAALEGRVIGVQACRPELRARLHRPKRLKVTDHRPRTRKGRGGRPPGVTPPRELVPALLDHLGCNQHQLAQELRVSDSKISNWKNGHGSMTEKDLKTMIRWLMGLETSPALDRWLDHLHELLDHLQKSQRRPTDGADP